MGLEILEQCPEVGTVFVPVGGGGMASGVAAAIKLSKPSVRIVAVEPIGAPKMTKSLEAGQPITLPSSKSIADGLMNLRPGDITFAHIRKFVDEVVTVSEEDIAANVGLAVPECAAGRRAERRGDDRRGCARPWQCRPANGPVVAVVSGGNVAPEAFAKYVARSTQWLVGRTLVRQRSRLCPSRLEVDRVVVCRRRLHSRGKARSRSSFSPSRTRSTSSSRRPPSPRSSRCAIATTTRCRASPSRSRCRAARLRRSRAARSTMTFATNAAGQAWRAGFTPLTAGAVNISIEAAMQGQVVTAAITQVNVMTAAEAARCCRAVEQVPARDQRRCRRRRRPVAEAVYRRPRLASSAVSRLQAPSPRRKSLAAQSRPLQWHVLDEWDSQLR